MTEAKELSPEAKAALGTMPAAASESVVSTREPSKPSKGAEIRPNVGYGVKSGRCENTDEVVGRGHLHVEQMDEKCFWARLDTEDGKGVVMWFRSKSPITLIAEFD